MIANMRYRLAVAMVYLASMAAFLFHPFDFPGTYSDSVVITVLVAAQLALGAAVGRWWALVLPVVVLLVLVPAAARDSEIPVEFVMMIGAVFTVPLVALGVIVRWLPGYRHRVRSRSIGPLAER